MLSKAMAVASAPQDIRKRKTLLEEVVKIKSCLNKYSNPEDASGVIFDSLVGGQIC